MSQYPARRKSHNNHHVPVHVNTTIRVYVKLLLQLMIVIINLYEIPTDSKILFKIPEDSLVDWHDLELCLT